MSFTRNWDESNPTDSTVANQIDEYNRYLRVDLSDRLKNMVYGLIAGENTLSQHFQYIQFYEQASVSQPSAGYGRLYTKAVSGKCELYWQDEDGDEIQLTNGGNFGGGNLELIANKDLIGSSTSDITMNTNKFTVAGATGNTVIAGTLTVADTLALTGLATLTGGLTSPAALVSTLATGTAPLTIASTTKVSNLNVDQVDGYDISAYAGGESYTFPGGLVIKIGYIADAGATTTVTFGAAFSTGVIAASVMQKNASAVSQTATISNLTTSAITIVDAGAVTGYYWIAIGY